MENIRPSIMLLVAILAGFLVSTVLSNPGFKLMTYNIRSGNNMANVFNISGTAHVIFQERPDVVTLQEVDNMTQRHPIDEVAFLSHHTHMPYTAFAPWRPFEGGQYGIALLSRHPILETRRHHYVKPASSKQFSSEILQFTAYQESNSDCSVPQPMDFCQGILAVKIAPPKFPNGIWIVTTHISADGAQKDEAKQLVDFVNGLLKESGTKDALVTGDFNEAPTGLGPSYLRKYYFDSFAKCYKNPANPNGFTFNSEKPDRRIDYIWATSSATDSCKRSTTIQTQASDHLPYVAHWN